MCGIFPVAPRVFMIVRTTMSGCGLWVWPTLLEYVLYVIRDAISGYILGSL